MKKFEFVNKPSGIYGLGGIELEPQDLLLIENDNYNINLGQYINVTLLGSDRHSSSNVFATDNITVFTDYNSIGQHPWMSLIVEKNGVGVYNNLTDGSGVLLTDNYNLSISPDDSFYISGIVTEI